MDTISYGTDVLRCADTQVRYTCSVVQVLGYSTDVLRCGADTHL